MPDNKMIPQGYMTVGELAKKMGVTVRTLQYYDKKGLLSPSAESEGGRRLYTSKDMVKLHQILSIKHLGFSLDAIKNHLTSMNTPSEVVEALEEQAAAIREKIASLTESLHTIELLQEEALHMQTVDFEKYADIIANLQAKNEFYWIIKHFDDESLDTIRDRFDKGSSLAMIESFTRLQNEANQLYRDGIPPESKKGQDFAKAYWEMLIQFTGGNQSLLSNLMKMESDDSPEPQWMQNKTLIHAFIEPALDAYFTNLGVHPFEEEAK